MQTDCRQRVWVWIWICAQEGRVGQLALGADRPTFCDRLDAIATAEIAILLAYNWPASFLGSRLNDSSQRELWPKDSLEPLAQCQAESSARIHPAGRYSPIPNRSQRKRRP